MSESMVEKLNLRLREALVELSRYDGANRLYWWRVASMQKLAAMGLAEQWLPQSVAERPRMKSRPYRITPAGRAALSNTEAREEHE